MLYVIIITLVIVLLLLFVLFKSVSTKSEYTTINNILIIASHVKKNYNDKIINNNLKNILNDKISLIIFVYSTDKDAVFEKNLQATVPIVYIQDKQNKYYDFYKYKLAYNYIKKNNIKFNWVFVTNDSVIYTENVSWIIDDIIQSNHDYVGVLETNNHIFEENPKKVHYQSWWLNFTPRAFEYWVEKISFNKKHVIKKYDKHKDITLGVKNIINDFEINLSNDMIKKFDTKVIFPIIDPTDGNVFWNEPRFNYYYYIKNFKFLKVKNIKHNLLPQHLKILFKADT